MYLHSICNASLWLCFQCVFALYVCRAQGRAAREMLCMKWSACRNIQNVQQEHVAACSLPRRKRNQRKVRHHLVYQSAFLCFMPFWVLVKTACFFYCELIGCSKVGVSFWNEHWQLEGCGSGCHAHAQAIKLMSWEKAHHFRGEEHFQIWIKYYEGKQIFLWIDLHELNCSPQK